MIDKEAELLVRHLKLDHLSRAQLGDISLARMSMTLSLISVTWLNGHEVDDNRVSEIANLVTAFMLGLPAQMTDIGKMA